MRTLAFIFFGISIVGAAARGADAPAKPQPAGDQTATYHVTGLFEPDREPALRAAVEKIPGVRLTSVDLDLGQATFAYDPAVAFKGTKPDKILERLDQLLRNASGHLLSLRPACPTARGGI